MDIESNWMTNSLWLSLILILVPVTCALSSLGDQIPIAGKSLEANIQLEEQDHAQMSAVTPVPTVELVQIEWDGVTLSYDPNLILDIEASTVPAKTGEDPYEMPAPSYTQFSLILDSGVILVVPIAAYLEVADFAEELFVDLSLLIDEKPEEFGDCVPELPLVAFFHHCDHQQFNANVDFVDFQNGSGVRFVTVYGIQDAVPVSNENLVYIFQGFTEDDKYYLVGGFRLTHKQLDEYVGAFPQEVYTDEDGVALGEYFSGYEELLNKTPEDFQPLLTRFDMIIESLRVE